jgi:hypothetical protein
LDAPVIGLGREPVEVLLRVHLGLGLLAFLLCVPGTVFYRCMQVN